VSVALPPGVTAEAFESNVQFYQGVDMDMGGDGRDEDEGADSDAEDGGEGERAANNGETANGSAAADQQALLSLAAAAAKVSSADNRCDLLWQGQMPKRCFTGFKFHESQNATAARKMMKGRGVGHFWDMLEGADSILASAAAPTLF